MLRTLGILILCALGCSAAGASTVSPRDSVRVVPAPRDTLAGTWRVDDGDPAPILIRRAGDGYTLERSGLWVGVGRLVEGRYEGRFESQRALGDSMRVAGLHHGRFTGEDQLDVTVIYTRGRRGARREVWRRETVSTDSDRPLTSRATVSGLEWPPLGAADPPPVKLIAGAIPYERSIIRV